jgi:hypothetical protein
VPSIPWIPVGLECKEFCHKRSFVKTKDVLAKYAGGEKLK